LTGRDRRDLVFSPPSATLNLDRFVAARTIGRNRASPTLNFEIVLSARNLGGFCAVSTVHTASLAPLRARLRDRTRKFSDLLLPALLPDIGTGGPPDRYPSNSRAISE
jgi:hypothetical protein